MEARKITFGPKVEEVAFSCAQDIFSIKKYTVELYAISLLQSWGRIRILNKKNKFNQIHILNLPRFLWPIDFCLVQHHIHPFDLGVPVTLSFRGAVASLETCKTFPSTKRTTELHENNKQLVQKHHVWCFMINVFSIIQLMIKGIPWDTIVIHWDIVHPLFIPSNDFIPNRYVDT